MDHLTDTEVTARFAEQVTETRPGVRPDVAALLAQHRPTSYRDDSPSTPTGAQPVPQHDPSIWGYAPKWAVGTAIAAPAAGVGSIGIGFGARLFFDSVTTEGVVMVGVIVGGAVAFVGSLAVLVKRLGKALRDAPQPVENHFHGQIHVQQTSTRITANGFARQRNEIEQ
ncbi:hypothetical protein ACTWJ8_40250 (plasmid) [Streptomyces sp. SDT5-1]|uniref:hypothetical protein n=1 Tax=Streptomyces sp. SDT5-1 TaxID=3406418 RepID=UPI003FD64B29